MKNQKVLLKSLVAHGRNSGLEYAKDFSNTNESFKSSLGFYITGETYTGKHGLSLRLDGMEYGINDNARNRAVVVHGADYVSKSFIKYTGRLGRSQERWGQYLFLNSTLLKVTSLCFTSSLLFVNLFLTCIRRPRSRWLKKKKKIVKRKTIQIMMTFTLSKPQPKRNVRPECALSKMELPNSYSQGRKSLSLRSHKWKQKC